MSVVINGTSGITTPGLDASGTNKFAATVGVGGATPAASGAGITFPATQSASSDANTLDDYEQGTWTPVIGGSGGTSGQSYTTQAGFYTKIGDTVIANFQVQLSAKGTITGYAQIQGLPFTSISTSTYRGGAAVGYFANLGANVVSIYLQTANSQTYVYIEYLSSAAASSSDATTTQIANTTRIDGTIVYKTAD